MMNNLSLLCVGFCIILCPLFYSACNEDDDEDELPPITMEGKNTFGCLVNGKVWLPKSPYFNVPSVDADYTSRKFLTVGSTSKTATFSFLVFNPIIVNQAYSLQDTSNSRSYYADKNNSICTYEDYHVLEGEIVISKFDLQNSIVSGTFEFTTYNPDCGDTIRVTEGRFDIGELTR